jgi:hypothetical protein
VLDTTIVVGRKEEALALFSFRADELMRTITIYGLALYCAPA